MAVSYRKPLQASEPRAAANRSANTGTDLEPAAQRDAQDIPVCLMVANANLSGWKLDDGPQRVQDFPAALTVRSRNLNP